MDLLELLKIWGPWGFPIVIAIRLWGIIEAEIRESRELRRARQKSEEETDREALGHLAAIRSTLDELAKRHRGESR